MRAPFVAAIEITVVPPGVTSTPGRSTGIHMGAVEELEVQVGGATVTS
jgi:hypothetical protein